MRRKESRARAMLPLRILDLRGEPPGASSCTPYLPSLMLRAAWVGAGVPTREACMAMHLCIEVQGDEEACRRPGKPHPGFGLLSAVLTCPSSQDRGQPARETTHPDVLAVAILEQACPAWTVPAAGISAQPLTASRASAAGLSQDACPQAGITGCKGHLLGGSLAAESGSPWVKRSS